MDIIVFRKKGREPKGERGLKKGINDKYHKI